MHVGSKEPGMHAPGGWLLVVPAVTESLAMVPSGSSQTRILLSGKEVHI